MPENPPTLPGTLTRPDAQRIVDSLNLRLHETELAKKVLEAKFPVTDANLTSPNNSVYRTLLTASANLGAAPASTYYYTGGGTFRSTTTTLGAALIYLVAADFTVASKTTKLRLRSQVLTNATSGGTTTITAGLYPVSASAGAAGEVQPTLGTVTSGSTVAFVNPASSTRLQGESGDFAFPAEGYYLLAVVVSANMAASSSFLVSSTLQVRNV